MSGTSIPDLLRDAVHERDGYMCAYYKTAAKVVADDMTIDHVVPESLGGPTKLDNLCMACWRCNLIKGQRIVGTDPESGEVVRFFHPVQERWAEHFAWKDGGITMEGLTPTRRATVDGLKLNRIALKESCELWIGAGWHPPDEDSE